MNTLPTWPSEHLEHLPIRRIDVDNRCFLFASQPPDATPLGRPLVVAPDASRFMILSGWREIPYYQALHSPIPCRVVACRRPAERYFVAVREVLASGPMTAIRKAHVLREGCACIGREKTMAIILPLLHEKPHARTLDAMLQLLQLPESLQRALENNVTQAPVMRLLMDRFAREDWGGIAPWLTQTGFSAAQQRTFLTNLHECSLKENQTASALLNDMHTIFRDHRQNDKDGILQYLARRRFPTILANGRRFDAGIKTIAMPSDTSLRIDPFQEAARYQLTIRFDSAEHLQTQLAQVRNQLHGPLGTLLHETL